MIQAQQLRIGNFLMDELTKEWLIVDEIAQGNISTTVINRAKYPLPNGWKLAHIPLTPEILEELKKTPIFIDKEGFVIFKNIEVAKNEVNSYSFSFTWNEYKYLHQLQNLYFALTGEELKYDPR